MNAAFIIPTGIGCSIGGHAGDATPAAKLIASCCDKLLVHPNVVNASDINEMSDNMWYVEGSILDRFLQGEIKLSKPRSNKILVAVNSPVRPETINAVSAARVTLGATIEMVELLHPLTIQATLTPSEATGTVTGVDELVEQVQQYNFDALGVATLISVDPEVSRAYIRDGGINPWGGAEAVASRMIAEALNKPVAHAPVEAGDVPESEWRKVNNPRMAPELVSLCYLHCILKGLHKAPTITTSGLSVEDIDVLVSPCGCWGPPHKACIDAGVPVILVDENKPRRCVPTPTPVCRANSYLEAAGIIQAWKQGLSLESVSANVNPTKIHS